MSSTVRRTGQHHTMILNVGDFSSRFTEIKPLSCITPPYLAATP